MARQVTEEVTGQLTAIRLQLDRAGDLLTRPSPESMEAGTAVLAAAASELAGYSDRFALAAGDAAALEEAWRVRRSFNRADRLLRHAAEFHSNWVQIRGAMAGGYTACGEAAPVLHASRLNVQG